jgi:hypothetical protein
VLLSGKVFNQFAVFCPLFLVFSGCDLVDVIRMVESEKDALMLLVASVLPWPLFILAAS